MNAIRRHLVFICFDTVDDAAQGGQCLVQSFIRGNDRADAGCLLKRLFCRERIRMRSGVAIDFNDSLRGQMMP